MKKKKRPPLKLKKKSVRGRNRQPPRQPMVDPSLQGNKKDKRSRKQKVIDWMEYRIKLLLCERNEYDKNPQFREKMLNEKRTIEDILRDLKILQKTLREVKQKAR